MANIIENYQKCQCGAITFYFEDGSSSSMRQRTAKKMGIDLRHYKSLRPSWNCNHCVNHWGTDLCECGSGEPVGKCSCGSNRPLQTFGEEYDSFSRIIANFS